MRLLTRSTVVALIAATALVTVASASAVASQLPIDHDYLVTCVNQVATASEGLTETISFYCTHFSGH